MTHKRHHWLELIMIVVNPCALGRAGGATEKGEPWTLTAYQRRVLEMALRRDPSSERVFGLVVLSEPKKSGKTFFSRLSGAK